MIDHFLVPSGDAAKPWVYLTAPRTPEYALLPDAAVPVGVRAEPRVDERLAADALAVLVSRGPDSFAITRARVNGRAAPGGMARLGHQDALSLIVPEAPGSRDGQPVIIYACTDGLVEVFEYEPPEGQSVPALCAACGLPLKSGERVRRACPGPGAQCGMLIHEECASSRCPACQQEITDPTGQTTVWMPGA
jgi:hypothetical protein